MVAFHILGCQLMTGFLLTTYFPANYAQLENNSQPEVTIPQGTLLGTTLTTRKGRNVSAFLGIPYGQPPIGNLRFANPVPADGWNGTLNASVNPSQCPQILTDAVVGEEDCLFVKVYTPQLPQNAINSSLLPVMVFIHGGRFAVESPTSIDSGFLLDADVVLVLLNYRLGPLGFLSTGDEVASGNWGLKDQVLALKWIKNNIHYFGGDPNQVTIFGESAGAASVHLLSLSNTTIGLFHKYITQSGSAISPWAHRPRAAYSSRAFELGDFVGCSNGSSDSLISCLRTIDFSDITAAQTDYLVWELVPGIVWGPTDEPNIDGAFLTDSPSNLIAAGGIRDIPWMSGIVRDEGLLFSTAMYLDKEMFNYFLANSDYLLPIILSWTYESDSGAARTNAAKSYYLNTDLTSNASVILKNTTLLFSDASFIYPTINALQRHHPIAVNPQYLYSFNYRGALSWTYLYGGTTDDFGIAHGDDLFYLFPMGSEFSSFNTSLSEADYKIVDTMVQLWTSFAINGTPTASALNGLATWEPYSTELGNYLRIGNNSDSSLEVQYSFFDERMQFWATIDDAEETNTDSGIETFFPNLI